jgi:dual specificity protein kinase YAK1
MHPFITGEKFTAPFSVRVIGSIYDSLLTEPRQPIGASSQQTPSPAPATTQESRRPYGGLVPSQPRGTRAYQDAATYNHHLAQHQAYTAQAQAASQAANNSFRNPYMQQQQQQPNAPAQPPPPSSYAAPPQEAANASFGQQAHQSQHPSQQVQGGQRQVAHQNSAAQLSAGQGSGRSLPPSLSMNPNPPTNSYYPGNRGRANTINQMDAIPPALARLQHMNQDVIAGRNALTPVLNRDDAIREWERRQAGKPREAQPYPQLEYLQQQAEMVGTPGFTGWQQSNQTARYPPPSKLAQSYHPQTIIVDEDRRDAVMSNVRSAARGDAGGTLYGSAAPITAPAQAYTGSGPASAGTRYTTSYTTQQPSSSSFDQLDQRTDVGAIYAPIQPNQHQAYNRDTSAQSSQQPSHGAAPNSRHGPPPAQNLPASFYPGSVVAPCLPGTAQPGGLFSGNEQRQGQKDLRRGTSMDVWPR